MEIRISRHAKRRMKERNILYNEIVEAVESPEEISPSIKGRVNYCKTAGDRHIKVTCKENPAKWWSSRSWTKNHRSAKQ